MNKHVNIFKYIKNCYVKRLVLTIYLFIIISVQQMII